ncbi:ribosomal-protein-alanine N-acetyltransferase [Gracilibacillus ureilyticus]|uniref:Ribosomal-protein-alanine N-acetyltransferase n=1 Tax=Gracilibacillus ureilyticus TaxID=531814 RepID=A0A1H9V9T5_9BACI|nr:GNAT family protein [Gracilibacillus ureilyticus]SES18291.1 ribosomal-protein-alanine N-acetyltransferase [Gracilibacillus ureilyticus]
MKIEDIYGDLPTLETDRLILRKVTMEDVEDMYIYGSDEEVSKYVTWDTHQSLKDTKGFVQFILNQYETGQVAPWGIEYKENRKFIGTIDFITWEPEHNRAEIGYVISKQYWGKGLTAEAAREIIRFGFNSMDLIRIQARCVSENTGSKRVMEKAGMSLEGIMRKGMVIKGKHRDIKLYSIIKGE